MSVTLSLFAGAGWQFFDNNGVPLAGGLIYTYAAGTTTPQATYTTSAGTIAQSNPIVLNSAGRVAVGEVWVTDGAVYKFVLKDSTGTTIGTYDNINSTYVAADLANTTDPTLGDALVGFRQSDSSGNLTGAVGRTVHQKFQESISVLDFGADPTGVADSLAAFNAAAAVFVNTVPYDPTDPSGRYGCGEIIIPHGKYSLSGTWNITKSLKIIGVGRSSGGDSVPGSMLIFPANTTGIRIWSPSEYAAYPAVNSGTGGYTTIQDIGIVGTLTGSTTGHGIYASAKVWLERVSISSFAQNGINFVASVPTSNANNSSFKDVFCGANGGHGLYVNGTDVNACTIINMYCQSNTGWGIYDSSFLGNTYIGCDCSSNTLGPYKSDNINARNVFIGCYSEGGANASVIAAPALVFGGLHGVGFTTTADSTPVISASSALGNTLLVQGALRVSGGGSTTYTTTTLGATAGAASDTGIFLEMYSATNTTGVLYRKLAQPASSYVISDFGPSSGYQYKYEFAPGCLLSDDNGRPFFGTWHAQLNAGVSYSKSRIVSGDYAVPASGTWSIGDYVRNTNPSVGQPKGWVCTVSGTFGTLSAVTGSITVSTAVLTVNTVSGLSAGMAISIAGVSNTKFIQSINGLVVTLTTTADATVTGAAVTYAAPTFVSEGNL